MRDKLYRFMQGRNGMDELARMQSWLVLILLLVGMFTRIGLFSFVALILMIYMYFRVFSRNTSKRYEENQKYLNFRYNRTVSWNRSAERPEMSYHNSKVPVLFFHRTLLIFGKAHNNTTDIFFYFLPTAVRRLH